MNEKQRKKLRYIRETLLNAPATKVDGVILALLIGILLDDSDNAAQEETKPK